MASKKQPSLCVTFRMLNIAQFRSPSLSAPGGSEPPLKVGSHFQISHTSLNSKPFNDYQPGQRTEAPLSNIPGVFSAPLALPAVLSETRGREWGVRVVKGTNLSGDDLLARQHHPYLSWFRTIKWDAFCLSASCCSRKGFPVPCCHKLTGNFTLLIPYSYECSLTLQISLLQRKQLLMKLSLVYLADSEFWHLIPAAHSYLRFRDFPSLVKFDWGCTWPSLN